MITPLLRTALEPIADQHRRLRLMHWLSLSWMLVALVGVALLWSKIGAWTSMGLLLCAALTGVWIVRMLARAWEPDWQGVARRVEERHPELHALLLTAVEQSPDPRTRQLNYLQQRVIAEAVRLSRLHNWLDVVPQSRSVTAMALQVAAFAAMLTAFFVTYQHRPISAAKTAEKQSAALVHDGVEITPGDAELERGSGLVVLATFRRDTAPSEATLVVQPQNKPERRMPLAKNLNDPAFGGGLPEVDSDMTYRVEYAGRATRDFKVKVFEHPRLDRADVTVRYPDYIKLPERKLPDTRRVSAVEGSKLDVAFQLNKPVKSAALVSKDGKQQVPLTVEAGKAAATLRDFTVQTSQSYELKLVDADGRASKTPAQFVIEAAPNRRPELKFISPKGDQRVSPIEEVAFRAQAWDDFGLVRYGIALNIAGKGEKEIELGKDSRPDEKREMSHLLKLEDVGVKPDELLSWYVWAEDIGPDGKPRRTETDMFFGEVRPFEEIFRRGDDAQAEEQQRQQQQQQQGGGQGGGDQATKLADLQKQVITATWNLKRAEDAQPKSPSEKYLKNVPAVRDGQNDALQQATALNERATDDPKSRALVENVTREMQNALDKLNAATKATAPLPDALAAEQLAYNALLKLASHEFNVARQRQQNRGQQQAGGGQQQDRQRQQLDELELKDERQRYETNRQAAPQQQNEQQRAQLATINRLKELAQRQQDINERLKELQTTLQAAKTEQAKEEAKQQLKRLREEEQQMLADMDETRQQMDRSPNQGQTAEDRQRLDNTRNEAQQASEAMQRGAASQALASGARTQQQLQDMRDDLRKKTSGQFNDDMRQMRQDARELAQNQEQIAEQLKSNANPGNTPQRRSLEESSDRQNLADQLKKQQEQLSKLAEQMKRVSEQSEVAEPLLSKELYDALRKNTQAGTDQKLQRTQLLAERGYPAQAQEFEQKAHEEIEDLKTGVERAAESVLGNEAESLRQARGEVDALSEQLNREIAQARPDLAANNNNGNRAQRGSQAQERQPGQQQSPQGQGDEQNGTTETGQPQTDDGNARAANPQGQPRRANQPGNNARNQLAQAPRGATGQPQDPSAQNGEQANAQNPGQQDGNANNGPANQPGQNRQRAQLAQNQAGRRAGQQPGQENANDPSGAPTDEQAQNGESGQQTAQQGQEGQQPNPAGRRNGRGQTAQRNASPNGNDPQAEGNQASQGQEQPNDEPGQGQNGQQLAQNQNGQRGGARQRSGRGQQQGQGGQQGQPGQDAQQGQPGDAQDQPAAGEQAGANRTAQSGRARGGNNGGDSPADQNNVGGQQADDGAADPNAATPEEAQRRARAAQLLSANSPARQQAQQRGGNGARAGGANNANGGSNNGGAENGGTYNGGGGDYNNRPLTGEEFVQWSDRLRNVEEMLDAPDLRNEVTRIREYARGVRVEYKRHAAQPDWDAVQNKISQPLSELRNRLTEELARRESKENLVPIDRDPVPNKYAEGVRRYYEELGLSR